MKMNIGCAMLMVILRAPRQEVIVTMMGAPPSEHDRQVLGIPT